jgi:hypothetical protein
MLCVRIVFSMAALNSELTTFLLKKKHERNFTRVALQDVSPVPTQQPFT